MTPLPVLPASGAATVLSVVLALWLALVLAGAGLLRRSGWLAPEPARKLVHGALGLTAASLPWWFGRALVPVWVLCALALLALLALRASPPLRRRFGGALHDVDRRSWGDLFFPVGVALCWSLAPGDPLRFSLPMLVLAVADALAALVGRSYGQRSYASSGARKTWEGSLAFALVTFLLAELPLLLGTDLGRGSSLLIALNLAVLLALVEGLAWRGGDNLAIPLVGLLALRYWLELATPVLAAHTAALLLLAALCWALRRWTTLDGGAVLACAVIAYLSWVLGGLLALLAPAAVFLAYGRLYPPAAPEQDHRALIPLLIATPALGWLLLPAAASSALALVAAAGSYAAQLACIGLVHGRYRDPERPWGALALGCWWRAELLVVGPTLLALQGPAVLALAAALGGLAALLVFGLGQPIGAEFPVQPRRWLRQSLLTAAGSAAVLLVP